VDDILNCEWEEILMDDNNVYEGDDLNNDQNSDTSEERVQIQKEVLEKSTTVEPEQVIEPQYQPSQQEYNDEVELEKPVSVGEWMLTTLVMLIPIVNIVMVFVWAFSKKANKSKSNYFKAALIWLLIEMGVLIVILIALIIVGIMYYSSQF
jgi:ATP-dependent Zn protease